MTTLFTSKQASKKDYKFRTINVLLLSALSTASYASITSDWIENGHHYMSTDTPTTWTEANNLAISLGGYLASITSQEEQQFLESTFLSSTNKSLTYWIGLTDAVTEGSFAWTSGEAVTYTNWGLNEPNDYRGGIAAGIGEDYAVFNWQYAHGFGQFGAWNDAPTNGCTPDCTQPQLSRAIIEFNQAPVPVPAAAWLFGSGLLGVLGLKRRRA